MGRGDPNEGISVLSETSTLGLAGGADDGGRAYLLVVQKESSSLCHLPRTGMVLIGRTPEAELRLEHASVSRRHARIAVDAGVVRLSDLESHNGTKVNGELLVGTRTLSSGDVVMVGEVVLVLHSAARAGDSAQAMLPEAEWRRRLTAEVARALSYGRPVAVTVIAGIAPAASGALVKALRVIDVIGQADDGQLLVLHPELGRDDARAAAERVVAQLTSPDVPVTAGYATCPTDACDADTLLLAARAASRAAAPGHAVAASEAVTCIELGDRRVLLAHPAMIRVFDLIKRLAAHDLPILITGETGAGKENAAFAVHWWSQRQAKPFVTINCAAIPETLVESELFGHERGAFSGAVATRAGLFESAAGGTIFLDEVGELPLAVQAKLLRALEAKKITRLGDVKERAVDVRIVAATNRALEAEVKAGRFREDLYFRLGAATVILPPLRERRADIPVLARDLLAQACTRAARPAMVITPAAMQRLATHDWPGNVRELRNVMDYVAAAALDDVVEADDLPASLGGAVAESPAVDAPDAASTGGPPSGFRKLAVEIEALEQQRMREALDAAGGVKTKAAQLIGMPIRTFALKLKQYGLGGK